MKIKSSVFIIILLVFLLLLLTGCAPTVNSPIYDPNFQFGFWGGLWHGICVPMSFLGRILPESTVAIYAINNTGKAYDVGFCLGLAFLFGAGCYVNYEIRRSKEY